MEGIASHMLNAERIDQLRNHFIANKYASISELAGKFNISTATVRRCLRQLENEQFIESVHGGAVIASSGNLLERPYSIKRKQNSDEKSRIAVEACKYVKSNSSIFLDSSTTVMEMIPHLRDVNNIIVATNDIQIASALNESNNLTVTVIGGTLRKGYYTLCGYFAEMMFSQFQVDCAFMGIDTINARGNLMITNSDEIGVKRLVNKVADNIIILCDHTKFQQNTFLTVFEPGDVDVVITGKELGEQNYNKFTDLGLNIIMV